MSRSVRRRFSLLLALSTTAGQIQGKKRIHITKSQNESGTHILLKVLAYVWFFERNPVIEPRLNYRYRPDVATFSLSDVADEDRLCKKAPFTNDAMRIDEWVECKKTAPKKIQRILRSLNDCSFSLFHMHSALEGYKRVLGRVLKQEELSRVQLFGITGDLESYLDPLRSARSIIACKKPNLITFSGKEGAIIGQFPIEQASWGNEKDLTI
ncbi:MAG: hypothetical protein ACE5OZ_25170 [Candidatus Heimdallarchaeota archaeon]